MPTLSGVEVDLFSLGQQLTDLERPAGLHVARDPYRVFRAYSDLLGKYGNVDIQEFPKEDSFIEASVYRVTPKLVEVFQGRGQIEVILQGSWRQRATRRRRQSVLQEIPLDSHLALSVRLKKEAPIGSSLIDISAHGLLDLDHLNRQVDDRFYETLLLDMAEALAKKYPRFK